jgi:uncharacterized protein (TIGR02452 family)
MLARMTRAAIARHTLQLLKEGHYTAPNSSSIDFHADQATAERHSTHYRPDDFTRLFAERDRLLAAGERFDTQFESTAETMLEAAERLSHESERLFVLNFASAKNPGGGFLGGAQAQEESLARSSGLYPCLLRHPDLYATNRRLPSCLYTDDMIYSPAVPVLKRDDGTLLDRYYRVSFLTSAAVNAGVVRTREPENVAEIEPFMLGRMEKLLTVAVVHGYRTLLLGAWGCGIFRNDPEQVAAWFDRQLRQNPVFRGAFERVVFAVYDRSKEQAVARAFERFQPRA